MNHNLGFLDDYATQRLRQLAQEAEHERLVRAARRPRPLRVRAAGVLYALADRLDGGRRPVERGGRVVLAH